jgi:hypothetical protein
MISSDKGITSKRLSILVDTAISSAYHDGFPHHAALASERAGIYFLGTEDEKLASKYLSRASILYAEWGAIAKVKQLEIGYGKYLNADDSQMRGLKKRNSIPSGSLMFTDKKSDSGTQLAGKIHTGRSRSQGYHRSPSGSRSPITARRNSSSDSQMSLILKRKKPVVEKAQSSHTKKGRPVLSKAAKEANEPRSKSLMQVERPSLVRIGSWASTNSLISNVSEDKTTSRRSKKKNSSMHSRGRSKTKLEKGKFQRSKSTGQTLNVKRKPSGEREKKNRGKSVEKKTSTPVTGKKKTSNGPTPSPKPGRNKVVKPDEGSYLLDYNTDDFDTIDGDESVASFASEKTPDESEPSTKRQASERPTRNGKNKGKTKTIYSDAEEVKDKAPKKPNRKKKKDFATEESHGRRK